MPHTERVAHDHNRAPVDSDKAKKSLGKTAAERTKTISKTPEYLCDTPEKATARIQQIGEAIFGVQRKVYDEALTVTCDCDYDYHDMYAYKRVVVGDDNYLQDDNVRCISWQQNPNGDSFYTPVGWHTFILERIPASEGSFRYRILEPDSRHLTKLPPFYETKRKEGPDGGLAWDVRDNHDYEVTASLIRSVDASFLIQNRFDEIAVLADSQALDQDEDTLALLQASVREFEKIYEKINWGS